MPLEGKGIDYHIVAHSHGGNVVREALQQSEKNRTPLKHLRSWTTVGTPFLLVEPSPMAIFYVAFVAIIALIVPAAYAIYKMTTLHTLITLNDFIVSSVYFVTAFFLLISLILVAWAHGGECHEVHREKAFLVAARDRHLASWLGIWSSRDEAVNGLRHAVRAAGRIVPRSRKIPRRGFASDREGLGITFFSWLYRCAFNRVFAPSADRFVRKQLRAGVTGYDRPGSGVGDILAWPFAGCVGPATIGLPAAIDERIIAASDACASTIAARLRVLLAARELRDEVSGFASQLTFRELVHNSYFDDEDVARIIAFHINMHSTADPGVPGGRRALPDLDQESRKWYFERIAGPGRPT